MKTFDDIKRSLYSPEYYSHVLTRPFWSSVKTFYITVIWLALAITILVSLVLVPAVNSFVTTIGPKVVNYYPDGLTIAVSQGKASSSVQGMEPYKLPIPAEFKNTLSGSKDIPADTENLIVIDTKDQFDMAAFRSLKTFLILNRDTIAISGSNGKVTVQPLGNAPEIMITKASLVSFMAKANQSLKFLPLAVVFMLFLGLILFMSNKLLALVLAALGIWAIFKIKKLNIGYKKSYQVGLHAATAGLILDYLFFFLLPGVQIPFFFTMVTLLVVWFNFPQGGGVTIPQVAASAEALPSAEPPKQPEQK